MATSSLTPITDTTGTGIVLIVLEEGKGNNGESDRDDKPAAADVASTLLIELALAVFFLFADLGEDLDLIDVFDVFDIFEGDIFTCSAVDPVSDGGRWEESTDAAVTVELVVVGFFCFRLSSASRRRKDAMSLPL